ncbi:MAG: 2-dehydropantoate 2-reductase [Thermoprotei archaeon]
MYYDLCIIGGGAIGSILAYYAYRGGFRDIVVYYASYESVREVEKQGGILVEYSDKDYLVPVKPRHSSSVGDKCLFIINAVKAYSVPDTIDLMKRISTSDSLILMIQNGFGSLELAEERLPDKSIAGGVVFIGAERRGKAYAVHHGGETVFAGCRKGICWKLQYLGEYLKRGGCDFRIVGDIDFYRWIKIAVNAVINPLTAIARARNEIVLLDRAKNIARKILEELVIVAEKYGYKLDPERLLKMVLRGAENTRYNYSSMAQDIINCRKTEIDYINGYIAKHFKHYSFNAFITDLVHLIEEYLCKE